MKNKKQLLLLAIFSTIISFSYGQPIAELYLQGKWKAECPMEVLDHASWINCQLCPWVQEPDKKSSGNVKDIEMTFGADSLTLNQNGTINTVAFTRDKDTHAISFTLSGKPYYFRVFLTEDQYILEDGNGLLMVLTKIE